LAAVPWAVAARLPLNVPSSQPGTIYCGVQADTPYDYPYGGGWKIFFKSYVYCSGGWDDALVNTYAQVLFGTWATVEYRTGFGAYAGTYVEKGYSEDCQANTTWRTKGYGQVYHGNIWDDYAYSNAANIDCK
jgi:hypothetical protein